ncbi:MAG: hypothetical protein JW987_07840 [Anaerolineaceae bacterium]|nr:hypothetical protein [Anaerolineaceae bacterium]
MDKKSLLSAFSALMVFGLILSACTTQATPEAPTLDANAIYTQAAETVAAGLELTQQAMPTSTVTPIPPATATPTVINAQATQPGPDATQAAGGDVTLTVQPSLTPMGAIATAAPATSGDKMEWITNTPADNSKVQKGAFIEVFFTIKNTGTTTWTGDYTIRYFAGDTLGTRPVINFPVQEVKPGETVKLPLGTLQAPQEAKATMTWWKITNAEGKNFGDVTLELEITN